MTKTELIDTLKNETDLIKRSKEGVDVSTLIKNTGFEDKKIRNIITKAFKQGKIKRAGRGVYVEVGW